MSDNLSQNDIDQLLSGNFIKPNAAEDSGELEYINETEADALGEIGNISMGASATTLSMLLGHKVEITTPKVREYGRIEDLFEISKDCVTIEIQYKEGIDGSTIFALNIEDTAIIADLMMGGDGKIKDPEIGELQLSAVGEAMNQMIGSAAVSMSSMFNTSINITPPIVKLQKTGQKLDLLDEIFGVPIVAVSFSLKVGDIIDSEIMQLMSLSSAQNQVSRLMSSMNEVIEEVSSNAASAQQTSQSQGYSAPPPMNVETISAASSISEIHQKPVTVQPVQFASFDESPNVYGEANKNLDLVMDVKLKLTVELGKTELPIKKVLELTRGSVIELDKVAGEPVELLANGKLIAKGEVVVIEDNFGLRITSIISPDNRLKNL